MFFKWATPSNTHVAFACLPYISGLTQPVNRLLLRNNGIQVTSKPFRTLQQEFLLPKFRPATELQSNVVYKIPCSGCSWCYIGETGRCFQTRKKEHVLLKEIKNIVPRAQTLRITPGQIIILLVVFINVTKTVCLHEKH